VHGRRRPKISEMIKAGVLSNEHSKHCEKDVAMDQYLLIPFLVG